MNYATQNFTYTDHTEVFNSSAVEDVWYNRNTKGLAVELLSGDTYVYDDVPENVYESFGRPGASAGHLYAVTVKREYGPGTYVGYSPDFDEDYSVPAPSMGNVHTPSRFGFTEVKASKGLSEAKVFDLAPSFDGQTTRPHSVTFDVVDGATDKTYDLDAASVDEAVNALLKVAEVLGVEVTPTSVTVSLV